MIKNKTGKKKCKVGQKCTVESEIQKNVAEHIKNIQGGEAELHQESKIQCKVEKYRGFKYIEKRKQYKQKDSKCLKMYGW